MSEERAARLRAALAARGLVWPAPLEHHESLRSTSDVVRERARAGAAEWTTVIADTQAAGRGRWGRTWASPPGGLYLSTLLRPPPEAVGLLPLVAGVAVAEALSEWGVSTELKWPNDVLARGRKLAGVLGEASSSASGVEWVALGIGVNVGAEDDSLPPSVRENATSLRAETGGSPGLEEIAAAVMVRLTVWYDALRLRPSSVLPAWRARAAPWWGSLVEVHGGEGPRRGRMRDVDETGALVLDVEGGGSVRVLSGEVERVRLVEAGARDPERG